MKFDIKYSKFGNLFFFVSNLAEWHFSCRKEYNIFWRNNLPHFTQEENVVLKLFKKILKQYQGKSENKMSFPFLANAVIKKNLKYIEKKINKSEKEIVRKVIKLFQPKFQKIWRENHCNLRRFIVLVKELDYVKKIKKSLELIEIYFGKTNCKKITVYLLIAPKNQWGGGGANIGPKRITLEIGDISKRGIDWILRTLIHEATHICYQDNFNLMLRSFIQSIPKKDYNNFKIVNYFGNLYTVLNELITSSIIGEGLIDELVFKFPSRNQLERDIKCLDWTKRSHSSLLRKSAALALYSFNKEYLKEKRAIDVNYLERAWEFLKKFEQKYKKGRFKELASL
ncbi:MAG: hypothetical protein AB1643_00645 [Patescibacteria group bacterium]